MKFKENHPIEFDTKKKPNFNCDSEIKNNYLVEISIEIFGAQIKKIRCNVQKMAIAQNFGERERERAIYTSVLWAKLICG